MLSELDTIEKEIEIKYDLSPRNIPTSPSKSPSKTLGKTWLSSDKNSFTDHINVNKLK